MSGNATAPVGQQPLRQTEVQRLLNVYHDVVRTGRGRVVFLAGDPRCGRTTVLETLSGALSNEQPRPVVVDGTFASGTFVHRTLEPPVLQAEAGAQAVAVIASAASVFNPALGVIGALAQALVAGWKLSDQQQRLLHPPRDPAEVLGWLLRFATPLRPIVCLLDAVDRDRVVGPDAWASDVRSLAPEIASGLPVLLVVTLDGPEHLEPLAPHQPPPDAEPYLTTVARVLLGRNRNEADWHALRPLEREDIADWLGPTGEDIVERLCEEGRGNLGRICLTWQRWRHESCDRWCSKPCDQRLVQQVGLTAWELRWEWAPDGRERAAGGALGELKQHLHQLLDAGNPRVRDEEVEETLDLLALAAVQGRVFTAEAVADALERDADEVIDLLDDRLTVDEAHPRRVLAWQGWTPIDDPRTGRRDLSRYQFVSELQWLSLGDPSTRPTAEHVLALARALERRYSPQEHDIADLLSRLFAAGGDEANAKHYQRLLHGSVHREVLRWQAHRIPTAPKQDWVLSDYLWATHTLLDAGKEMLYTYPFSETLTVFQEAGRLAAQMGQHQDEAWALFFQGRVQNGRGELQQALQLYQQALSIQREVGDRRGEAATLTGIGLVYRDRGKLEEALEFLQQALSILREAGDRRGDEAATLGNIGVMYRRRGKLEEALEFSQQALSILREVGDRRGEAAALGNIGSVYHNRGKLEEALEFYQQALSILREVGDRQSEAATLSNIGSVYCDRGGLEETLEFLQQALSIQREVGDRQGEAATLNNIGLMYRSRGDLVLALAALAEKVALHELIAHPDLESDRRLLEEVRAELAASRQSP